MHSSDPYKMPSAAHNPVFRWFRLLLAVLFLTPCLVCSDSVAAAVVSPCSAALAVCPAGSMGDAHGPQTVPDCACLSDTVKVASSAPVYTPILAAGLLPTVSIAVPEPEPAAQAFTEPAPLLPLLLAREATSDRAPPSV